MLRNQRTGMSERCLLVTEMKMDSLLIPISTRVYGRASTLCTRTRNEKERSSQIFWYPLLKLIINEHPFGPFDSKSEATNRFIGELFNVQVLMKTDIYSHYFLLVAKRDVGKKQPV